MRKRDNFTGLIDSRKSNIDSHIRRDYIENGIATVNCCISDYHDIISTYSSKGQESLNFDFVAYMEGVKFFLINSAWLKRNKKKNLKCSF